MKKPKTSEAQIRAVDNYQKGKSRFVLWYPEYLKALLEKRGITAREVFEAGLRHFKISPLLLLLSCTSPESPETKKASFVLKEACKEGAVVWNPDPPPDMWNAFYVTDSTRESVDLPYYNGFRYPCSPSSPGTLEIAYQ